MIQNAALTRRRMLADNMIRNMPNAPVAMVETSSGARGTSGSRISVVSAESGLSPAKRRRTPDRKIMPERATGAIAFPNFRTG